MHVDNWKVFCSEQYFDQIGKTIDWEDDGDEDISKKQAQAVDDILTLEASIFLLRRVTGLCGILTDNADSIVNNNII